MYATENGTIWYSHAHYKARLGTLKRTNTAQNPQIEKKAKTKYVFLSYFDVFQWYNNGKLIYFEKMIKIQFGIKSLDKTLETYKNTI